MADKVSKEQNDRDQAELERIFEKANRDNNFGR